MVFVRAENVVLRARNPAPAGEGICPVSIKDQGAGIAKDVLPKILILFSTSSEDRKRNGPGADDHHAVIQKHEALVVDSAVGAGTTPHATAAPKLSGQRNLGAGGGGRAGRC